MSDNVIRRRTITDTWAIPLLANEGMPLDDLVEAVNDAHLAHKANRYLGDAEWSIEEYEGGPEHLIIRVSRNTDPFDD